MQVAAPRLALTANSHPTTGRPAAPDHRARAAQPERHPAPALDRLNVGEVNQPAGRLLLPRHHKPGTRPLSQPLHHVHIGGRGPLSR